MAEHTKILEFNNNGENGGIDDSRTYEGSHLTIEKINLGQERIEGFGKEFVKVSLQTDEGMREVGTFVAKSFGTKEQALREVKKCWYLEKAGVPIPPTRRYVEQGGKHYIIYTDFSEGGKNVVWSSNNLLEEHKHLELTDEQFGEVAYQMMEIAENAAVEDMSIASDAYFIVKTPDRGVHVVVGDLGLGVSAYPVSSHNFDCFKHNKDEVAWLLGCIKTSE